MSALDVWSGPVQIGVASFRCTDCGHRVQTELMFDECPACGASGFDLVHYGPIVEGPSIPVWPKSAAQVRAALHPWQQAFAEFDAIIDAPASTFQLEEQAATPADTIAPLAPPVAVTLKPDGSVVYRDAGPGWTKRSALPMRHLAELIIDFVQALAERTGRQGITRISLTPDLGLAFGIAPGTSVDVQTPVGRVEVYAERSPRLEGVVQVDLTEGRER